MYRQPRVAVRALSLRSRRRNAPTKELVIDNSADDTPGTVAALQTGSSGYAARLIGKLNKVMLTREAQASASGSSRFCVLDDDVEADANWVGTIQSAFNRYPVSFVAG